MPKQTPRKIKVTICNHQAASPLNVWPDAWFVICKFRKVWSYTALNVLTETRCHLITQTQTLEHPFFSSELPKPSLGDLADLRLWSDKVRREKNPNVLGYTYHELAEFDVVKVELVPEKKGLIIKHVEYEVTSRVRTTRKCCVGFDFVNY